MASIKRRPDGQWRARYRDPDGSEHAHHFERKLDAERWLDGIRGDLARGNYLDPALARVVFGRYAEQWLGSRTLRPSSRRTYAIYLRTRLLPALGACPLGSITPTMVRGLTRQLADDLAANTVRQVHGLLSAILAAAVEDGYLARNPCAKTAPARPRRPQVAPLTVAQVHALTDAVPAPYRAMVAVAAGCGLRLGEVLGLKVGRVRFLQRDLEVVEQLTLVPGTPPQLGPPKTRSSERTVPLPSVVADALAEHLAARPAADAGTLVFRSRTGGPVWPNSFHQAVWRPAVARAGLPAGTRFHDLRHFYASALIRAGESVKTVQAALGHASAVETLETYAALWPDAEQRTRAAVDGVLARPAADSLRTELAPHRL